MFRKKKKTKIDIEHYLYNSVSDFIKHHSKEIWFTCNNEYNEYQAVCELLDENGYKFLKKIDEYVVYRKDDLPKEEPIKKESRGNISEEDVYKIAYEFTKLGIDIEQTMNKIVGELLQREDVRQLIALQNKNYNFLLKYQKSIQEKVDE